MYRVDCYTEPTRNAGGAKVVTFDSDADPECRDIYITANATNQNAWIELMKN